MKGARWGALFARGGVVVFATVGDLATFAKEQGGGSETFIDIDLNGHLVKNVEIFDKYGNRVLFEDMGMKSRLTQARILHAKRQLKLW